MGGVSVWVGGGGGGGSMAREPLLRSWPALAPEHEAEAHWLRMQAQGFTLLPDVLPASTLAELQAHFDAVAGRLAAGETPRGVTLFDDQQSPIERSDYDPQTTIVGISLNELLLGSPAISSLLDRPEVMALVRRGMQERLGEEPELSGEVLGQFCPPGTGSDQRWHAVSARSSLFVRLAASLISARRTASTFARRSCWTTSLRTAASPPLHRARTCRPWAGCEGRGCRCRRSGGPTMVATNGIPRRPSPSQPS